MFSLAPSFTAGTTARTLNPGEKISPGYSRYGTSCLERFTCPPPSVPSGSAFLRQEFPKHSGDKSYTHCEQGLEQRPNGASRLLPPAKVISLTQCVFSSASPAAERAYSHLGAPRIKYQVFGVFPGGADWRKIDTDRASRRCCLRKLLILNNDQAAMEPKFQGKCLAA